MLGVLASCGAKQRQGPAIGVFGGKTPEQQILTQMTLQVLEQQGYAVTDRSAWGSEWMVRKAMVAGNADLSWAYTHDIWSLYLQHDRPIWDSSELYAQVRDEDALQGITWLAPSRCQSTMALVMRRDVADKYEIGSIDDLIKTIQSVDPTIRLGVPSELVETSSGLAGLERVYGYTFDRRYLSQVALETGYQALLTDACDVVLNYRGPASLYPELVVLSDARPFFPPSELTVGVRSDILRAHASLESHLLALSRGLTQADLVAMEQQVTLEGRSPQAVAREFLKSHDLLD